MSKKYVCELLRKVPLNEIDVIRDYYLDGDFVECDFSKKPLKEFIDFLESRIDENADSDSYTVHIMTHAVSRLSALAYLNKGLDQLKKETGFCPDLGDLFHDEITSPAFEKICEVVRLNDLPF